MEKRKRQSIVEEAREMVESNRTIEYGEGVLVKLTAEKLERESVKKCRSERFVRAMRRLGFLDYRNAKKCATVEKVRDEILSEGDIDADYWTVREVGLRLGKYVKGWGYPLKDEGLLGVEIEGIIHGDLGKGDVLSEALTADAIFDRLSPHLKDTVPFHAVRSYMFRAQEKELLRRRIRSQEQGEVESEEESPYMRLRRLEVETRLKGNNDKFRILLMALNRLGGEENKHDIPIEAVYKLITEELDIPIVTDDDIQQQHPYWTMDGLERFLRHEFHPIWTYDHHNRMLTAITKLGGDAFDEERVNPKTVRDLMDEDGTMVPMTLFGVKRHLGILRSFLLKDPSHPHSHPRKPSHTTLISCSFSPKKILDLASQI